MTTAVFVSAAGGELRGRGRVPAAGLVVGRQVVAEADFVGPGGETHERVVAGRVGLCVVAATRTGCVDRDVRNGGSCRFERVTLPEIL